MELTPHHAPATDVLRPPHTHSKSSTSNTSLGPPPTTCEEARVRPRWGQNRRRRPWGAASGGTAQGHHTSRRRTAEDLNPTRGGGWVLGEGAWRRLGMERNGRRRERIDTLVEWTISKQVPSPLGVHHSSHTTIDTDRENHWLVAHRSDALTIDLHKHRK